VTDGGGPPPGRLDQVALLTEQVKLLLRTEQRLLRAQRRADERSRRLEALSRFALLAPRSYSAGDIVALTLDLLWPHASVQAAMALVRPPPREGSAAMLLRAGDRPLAPAQPPLPPADPLWGTWAERVQVLDAGQDAGMAAPLFSLLDRLAPPGPWELRARLRRTLLLPLGAGPGSGNDGALLVCRCADAARAEAPEPADQTFLDLVRSHASAALEIATLNAQLEARVAARTRDLAQANEQLQLGLDQLRQTQSQLIETSRLAAVGQLAAEVAHDINNPLAALKASLAFLAREAGLAPGSGERAEALADALASVARISRSVARLREQAAPPAGPG
jgi:signal transduction histidine kinase